MNGQQAMVGGAQDVGLRQARPVARLRRLAEREVGGERLDREVRHRLKHRDLDESALARARALEQRGEDAVRGIDSSDCIGQRGPEEAGSFRVHDDGEESGQRLRDRVVARALGVGPIGPESADRAVDEPGIEAAQALGAGAEPLGRARAEVLDVDVGIRDELVEELAVGRLLEVAADAALVAVVGLEMLGIEAALIGAAGIAFRALDLDHVGAQVGEHHACAGAGDERALFDDPDSAEWRVEHQALGTNPAGEGPSYAMLAAPESARMKPIGRSCSSSRCAIRLAVRARIGTPFTARIGKPASSITAAIAPETFMTSGLPATSGSFFSTSRAISTWRPAIPASVAIASRRPTRGSARLCSGCP